MSRRFDFRYDLRLAPFWLPFGARPGTGGVELTDDGRFVATYGFFRVETPLDNVEGAHVAGPYRWWTAVGARQSFVDDGLTFGTNRDQGACVHFRENVRSRMSGKKGHSALTVTVADPSALVAALGEVGPR